MPEKGDNNGKGSFPPWSRIPSLQEMTLEAGIDHDRFLDSIQKGQSLQAMAEQFQVSEATVKSLYEHFIHYGISSVIGGD